VDNEQFEKWWLENYKDMHPVRVMQEAFKEVALKAWQAAQLQMIDVSELKRMQERANELIKDNIDSLPKRNGVNRADFKCNCVQYFMDSCGESGFNFMFDECNPNDSYTNKWLSDLLINDGFKNFSVILEW
jgi:hypothetical protein